MRPHRLILLLTALALFLQACAPSSPAALPTATKAKPAVTETVVATAVPSLNPALQGSNQKDITYCTSRGTDLKMDLYYPVTGEAPFPAVVYIHGGGWSEGDKSEAAGMVGAEELSKTGYIFISVNYRLAPGYRFPTMIEDVKCAVRSLKANAAQWSLDPDRIGVMGASAGGHLAALMGTADEAAGWDTGEGYDQAYLDQSSRVQAVVDLFGPADLADFFGNTAQNLAQSAFGVKKASDPFLVEASPTHYASRGDAPFLILHGTKDPQVSLEQSQVLNDALEAAGVDSTMVLVEGAGHGFPSSGQIYSPNFSELGLKIAEFFNEHLGG